MYLATISSESEHLKPATYAWQNYATELTLSARDPRDPGAKSDWRPYFLYLLIFRLLVVRLTRNQVQMKES
jgi:hypothetical protein